MSVKEVDLFDLPAFRMAAWAGAIGVLVLPQWHNLCEQFQLLVAPVPLVRGVVRIYGDHLTVDGGGKASPKSIYDVLRDGSAWPTFTHDDLLAIRDDFVPGYLRCDWYHYPLFEYAIPLPN